MGFWSTAGKIAGSLFGVAGTLGAQSLGGFLSYEQQRALNAEAFNREASYNHPAAQMQRLKQAGLNPNLIYGSGSANTGNVKANVGSAPSYALDPRIDENLLRYTNYKKITNDIKTQESTIDKLRKETQFVDTQIKSMNQDMAIKQAELKMQLQRLPYELRGLMSTVNMNAANIAKLKTQSKYDYGMSPYLSTKQFLSDFYKDELKGTPLGDTLRGIYNLVRSVDLFGPITDSQYNRYSKKELNRYKTVLKGRVSN